MSYTLDVATLAGANVDYTQPHVSSRNCSTYSFLLVHFLVTYTFLICMYRAVLSYSLKWIPCRYLELHARAVPSYLEFCSQI